MTNPHAALLELDNLCYSYGDGIYALQNISAVLRAGERIALLGNNGAGKSTFFLCCNGVLQPCSGTIRLNGRQIRTRRQDLTLLRKSVGIVFQDPDSQIIASTVEAEVSFGPLNLGMRDEDVRGRCGMALEAMNLSGFRARPPHYLSGGEKKRVSIADILAMEPDIILLDEPTASLDCAHTVQLEKTLGRMHEEGMGVVVSTHDVDFAWRFADRILVFSQGRLIADGDGETVFSNDALLAEAGLRKPAIFELSQALGLPEIPRTMEEFKCQIRRS